MKTCSDPSVWHVHVNVKRVRQLAHCTFSCKHRWLGSLHNYRTHQTVESQHVYMHVNVQWPVCLTCACKCAESQTIGSLHISMHTSVSRLTPHLYEHIRQSDHWTFACTHQVHVNVKWPVCLTCACKCAESQTIDSLHIFMHTLVILCPLPNYMNTSDSRFTAHLQAHIRCMKMCSDPSDWGVHVNVQRLRQLLTAHFHALNSSHNSILPHPQVQPSSDTTPPPLHPAFIRQHSLPHS